MANLYAANVTFIQKEKDQKKEKELPSKWGYLCYPHVITQQHPVSPQREGWENINSMQLDST